MHENACRDVHGREQHQEQNDRQNSPSQREAGIHAHLSAASAVIDRAAGKPVQAIEASGFTQPASELSDDELAAIIASERSLRGEAAEVEES